MAKIKSERRGNNAGYKAICAEQRAYKEREKQDCTVISLATATDTPYEEAHQILAAKGRKDGRMFSERKTLDAIREKGYKLTKVHLAKIIAKYPGVHKNLQNVTTHHPERFPEVWAEMEGTYVAGVSKHMLTIKDGRLVDWSEGRALRFKTLYKVTKK